MDAISEYVGQISEKKIEESQCIMAVPARVEKVMTNNMCLVNLIANGTQFVVPNWSGCDVQSGDEVRLFYTGSIVSERTAYIGAAAYMTNRLWSCVKGNFITDAGYNYLKISENIDVEKNISKYGFRSTHSQTVIVTFNGKLAGGGNTGITMERGTAFIKICVDGVPYGFDYGVSVYEGVLYCPIISLPFDVSLGDHLVEVKVSGRAVQSGSVNYISAGRYTDACSYVTGQGLTEVEVN